MSEEKKSGGLHIHLGGLVIIIIIILLFFKVDFKKVTDSPQFQKNLSYLKEQGNNVWDNYLSKPIKMGWGSVFNNLVDKGAEEIKKNSIFDIGKINEVENVENN